MPPLARDEPDNVELDNAVAELATRFRAALDEPSRMGIDLGVGEVRRSLDETLPKTGMPADAVLRELVDRTAPGLVGSTGSRYFGYVTGGVLPAAAIAQAWVAAVDQNTGLWALGPSATELEQLVLDWLAEMLDLPRGSAVFTSGAAGANLVSLAVARHWFGRRVGVDVNEMGVGALPPLALYGSTELHFTNVKAVRLLGLGAACVRQVVVDEHYRLDPAALETAIARDRADGIEPAIVVAHVGSPNTGAVDPLPVIADLCAEHDLWLHADAAYGAFCRLCPRTAPLTAGLERADSVTVDGHKWLNLPNGIGFAFLRDAELHHEALSGSAFYLSSASATGPDLHEYAVEASRPWRGAATWAALKALGRDGYAELVTRCCDLAVELGALVQAAPRLELTAPVATCVTCFRYRPPGVPEGKALDRLNRQIQDRLDREGRVLATGGMLPSGFSLRPAIVSWRARRADIELLAREVERVGDELSGLRSPAR